MTARISVLVNTFNHGDLLRECLASVVAQDGIEEAEIIVIDDGSADESARRICESFVGVRFVRKENGGQASAISVAIDMARGEVVSLLDGDDIWLPGKVRWLLGQSVSASSGDVFFDQMEVRDCMIGQQGTLPRLSEMRGFRAAIESPSAALRSGWIPACPTTSGLSFRREFLETAPRVPLSLRVAGADLYFRLLALAIARKVEISEESLSVLRIHGGNLWTGGTASPSRVGEEARIAGVAADGVLAGLRRGSPQWVSLNLWKAKTVSQLKARREEMLGRRARATREILGSLGLPCARESGQHLVWVARRIAGIQRRALASWGGHRLEESR